MDEELEEYFARTAVTDLFRLVSHLEIQIGNDMSVPLAEIVEGEAQARVRRILERDAEAISTQEALDEGTKKALRHWAHRALVLKLPEGDIPV